MVVGRVVTIGVSQMFQSISSSSVLFYSSSSSLSAEGGSGGSYTLEDWP